MDNSTVQNTNNKDPTNDALLATTAATSSSLTAAGALPHDANSQNQQSKNAKPIKPTLPAKKSFKSVSINTMFRSLAAASGSSGDPKLDHQSHHLVSSVSSGGIGRPSSGSSIATSNSPSSIGPGSGPGNHPSSSIFPKVTTLHSGLKIAPMKRDESQSPRPKSSSMAGGGDHHYENGSSFDRHGTPSSTATEPAHTVWNRNGLSSVSNVTPFRTIASSKDANNTSTTTSDSRSNGQPQQQHPPAKVFTEQELEKLGIRLVQRMDEHKLSDLGWDEMDDDDDANWGDTLEFDDGTKVVFKHDDPQQQGQSAASRVAAAVAAAAASSSSSSPPVIATQPIKSASIASTLEKHHQPQDLQIPSPPPPSDGSRPPVWGALKSPAKPQFTVSPPAPDEQPPKSSSNDARKLRPPQPQSPDNINNNNNNDNGRRFPTHDFDRYYGTHSRPPVRGELYNDRSGQFEPVTRRTNNKQQQPPITSPQVMLKTSSASTATQDQQSEPQSVESKDIATAPSPPQEATKSEPSTTTTTAPLSPNELAKQQEEVMKRARENARRRKEEEQQRERERLESSRKRAEAIAKLEARERAETESSNGKKAILQQGASDQIPKRIKTRDNDVDVDDGFSIPKVSSAEELEHPEEVKEKTTTTLPENDKSAEIRATNAEEVDNMKNSSSIWLFSYDSRNRGNWEGDKNGRDRGVAPDSNTSSPSSHVWGPIGSKHHQPHQHNNRTRSKEAVHEPHRNQFSSILTRDTWRRGGQVQQQQQQPNQQFPSGPKSHSIAQHAHVRNLPGPPVPPIVSTAPSAAVSSVFDSTTAQNEDATGLDDAIMKTSNSAASSHSSSSVQQQPPQQPSPGSSRSSSRFFPSPALKQQPQGEGFSHRPSSNLSRHTSESTNTIVADGWDRSSNNLATFDGTPLSGLSSSSQNNLRYPPSPSTQTGAGAGGGGFDHLGGSMGGHLDKLNTRIPAMGSIETLQNMITDRLANNSSGTNNNSINNNASNNNKSSSSNSDKNANQDDVLPQQRKSLSGAGAVGDTMMDVSTMPPVDNIRGFLMSDGDHVVRNEDQLNLKTPAYRVPVGVGRTSSASDINRPGSPSSSRNNKKSGTTAVGAHRVPSSGAPSNPPVSFASVVSAANSNSEVRSDKRRFKENLPKDRLAATSIDPYLDGDDLDETKVNLNNNLVPQNRTIAPRLVAIDKLDEYVERLAPPPGGYPRWVSTNTHFDPNRFIYDTPSYRVFLKHDVPAKIVYGQARDLSDKVLSNGEVIISTAHRRRQRQQQQQHTTPASTSSSKGKRSERPSSSHNRNNNNNSKSKLESTTTSGGGSSSNNKSTSGINKRSSIRGSTSGSSGGGRNQNQTQTQRKPAAVSV